MTSISSAYAGANATYGTVPAGRGRSSNDEGYNFPTMTRGQGRSLQQRNPSSYDENRRRSILPGHSHFITVLISRRLTVYSIYLS
jgi:hypothetical protein